MLRRQSGDIAINKPNQPVNVPEGFVIGGLESMKPMHNNAYQRNHKQKASKPASLVFFPSSAEKVNVGENQAPKQVEHDIYRSKTRHSFSYYSNQEKARKERESNLNKLQSMQGRIPYITQTAQGPMRRDDYVRHLRGLTIVNPHDVRNPVNRSRILGTIDLEDRHQAIDRDAGMDLLFEFEDISGHDFNQ